ncbi:MAG TPA: hypothetical protein V6D08_04570 [Candidatus Obscuribacterales bacterium]
MKTYIVPGLDNVDRELLHNHGVLFYPWGTEIIVDQSQLPAALQLLNATATEAPTEYEGMYMLTLQFNTMVSAESADKRALDRARSQSRANYIQACQARLKDFLTQAQQKVSEHRKKLSPAQDSFVALARQRFLAAQGKVDERMEREFREQFQRLLATPKVRAVRVTSGALLVYTETLYARDPRTGLRHELGEYLIVIRTDGVEDGVRWFNSTRRVRTIHPGMNAPRVFANGTACADEIKETLLELIAQFDFATVAELAIQFVETLTNDELSKYIDRWPVARETSP